jgi:HAD superfamily hydrolase (TIGR01509 family)
MDSARVRAVLFDLDGTLFDTDDVWLDSMLSRLGGVQRFRRPARACLTWGERIASRGLALLDRADLDDDVDRLAARVLAWRRRSKPGTYRLIAGVVEMLEPLAARYPLAVVTTRSRARAQTMVAGAALDRHFRVISARDDTRRIKPHPEPIEHVAGLLGVSPAECLMVGDTTPDILAAKAAGAQSVGVLCGFGREADLRRAGADWILPSTAEVGALLGNG